MEISPVDGQVIKVRVGKLFTLTLPTAATSGFEWVPEFKGEAIALERREFRLGNQAIGAQGTEALTFLAVQAGNSVVTLCLKRRWEVVPRERIIVQVHTTNE